MPWRRMLCSDCFRIIFWLLIRVGLAGGQGGRRKMDIVLTQPKVTCGRGQTSEGGGGHALARM